MIELWSLMDKISPPFRLMMETDPASKMYSLQSTEVIQSPET
jgi:hypothetical protein